MKNKVTYFLLATNLIVFVLFNIRYGTPVCGDIAWRTFCINNFSVLHYGQVNSLLLEGKNLYQLITKLFLHKASFHLIWNVVALFYFGKKLESNFGSTPIFLSFFISGISTSLATLTLGSIISIGASGAIIGVVSTWVILEEKRNAVILFALFVILFHFPYFIGANINFISHLSGLFSGLTFGILYKHFVERK